MSAPDDHDAALLHRVRALQQRAGALIDGIAAIAPFGIERAMLPRLASLARTPAIDPLPPAMPADDSTAIAFLSASPFFDRDWYGARNRDVDAAGIGPALHYARHGWREGRDPGPAFDGRAYLAANRDLDPGVVDPLGHYQANGAHERRPAGDDEDGAIAGLHIGDRTLLPVDIELRSFEDYVALREGWPYLFADGAEDAVREHACRHGTDSIFQGRVPPDRVAVSGPDLREHLLADNVNSRQRAVGDLVVEALRLMRVGEDRARVYGHEAVTPYAGLMRARFPRYLGSEYAPTEEEQEHIFPAPHNDVCASRFADATFDVTFSCDVLEHVQDRDAMLAEAARTTRPGGAFIATFPFEHDRPSGWLMARLTNDGIEHLIERPIYHGNPMSEGGSLVFEIPGWDIIGRALAAGFSDAAMRFVCDPGRGIAASALRDGAQPRGVFVLVCWR